MKIILVEDDLVDQMAFSRWIAKELPRCQLELCNDLREVTEKLSNFDFDLVVCDYNLPDGNLLDVVKLVDNPSEIICISGLSNPQKIQQLKEVGVSTFLFKDNELNYLSQFKQFIIKKHNLPDHSDRPAPAIPIPVPSENLININHLLRIFDQQTDPVKDIITIFLQQTPIQLAELHDALQQDKIGRCHSLSHRLKSSYRMMGLVAQMEIIEEIETICCKTIQNRDYYLGQLEEVRQNSEKAYVELREELAKL